MDNFLVGIKFDATPKKLEKQLKQLLSGIQEASKTLKIRVDIEGIEQINKLANATKKATQTQEKNAKATREQQQQVSAYMRLLRERNTLENKLLNAGKLERQEINKRIQAITREMVEYEKLTISQQQQLKIDQQQARAVATNTQLRARQADSVISLTQQVVNFGQASLLAVGKFAKWALIAQILLGVQRAIKDTFNTVKEMDAAMTSLSITTGKSAEDFKELRAEVERMSVQLGQLATDIIMAANEFQRAGFNIQDSITLAKNALIGANVGMSEVAETTRFLVSTLQAFNLTADDSQRVVDVMFNVSKNAAVSFNQLGEGLARTAAFMAEANLTFEEGTAILTGANQSIQNMEKSSTAFRTILANLFATMEDGGETVPKFEEDLLNIGVALRKSDGQFRDTIDIVRDLQSSFANMTDQTEKQRIALELAGKRNVAVFFSMINNGKIMEESLVNAFNSTGEAAQANEIYVESIEGKLKQLGASIDKLQTTILSSDAFKFLIDALQSGVNYMQDMADSTAVLAGSITNLAIAFTSAKLALSASSGGLMAVLGVAAPEIVALGAILTTVVGTFVKYKREALETARALEEFEVAQQKLNETIAIGGTQDLEQVISKLEILKLKLEEANDISDEYATSGYFGALAQQKDQLEEINKEMNELGVNANTLDSTLSSLNDSLAFQNQLDSERKALDIINDKQDEISTVDQLAQQYSNLSKEAKENNAESQKMSIIAKRLQSIIPEVSTATDEYGNVQIKNIDILKDWIAIEKQSVLDLQDASTDRLTIIKNETEAAIRLMQTQMTARLRLEQSIRGGLTGIGEQIKSGTQGFSFASASQESIKSIQKLASDPAYQQLENQLSEIDSLLSKVADTSTGASVKISRGNDKTKKSTKEVVEFVSELSSRYNELNRALSETNEALEDNNKQMSIADDEHKLSLLVSRIQLLQELKSQLHEINQERRTERDELRKQLEQMGIYSDIINDRTIIMNLQDINNIIGEDTKSTNALRKEAENLVKEIQSMDSAINKTGQDWKTNNTEIIKQMQDLGDEIEEQREKIKDFNKETGDIIQDSYNKQRESILNAIEALKSYEDEQEKLIGQSDERIDKLEEEYDKLEKQQEDNIAKIKEEIKLLEQKKEVMDIDDEIEKKQDLIRAEKEIADFVKESYNNQINALKEEQKQKDLINKEEERQKELQEKQNELQKQRNELINIQRERTVKLFQDGQFKLVADPRKVAEAQENIAQTEKDIADLKAKQDIERAKETVQEKVKLLEKERDAEQKLFEDSIKNTEKEIKSLESKKKALEEYYEFEEGSIDDLIESRKQILVQLEEIKDKTLITKQEEIDKEKELNEDLRNDLDKVIDKQKDELKEVVKNFNKKKNLRNRDEIDFKKVWDAENETIDDRIDKYLEEQESLQSQLESKLDMRQTDLDNMIVYANQMISAYNSIAQAKANSEGTVANTIPQISGGQLPVGDGEGGISDSGKVDYAEIEDTGAEAIQKLSGEKRLGFYSYRAENARKLLGSLNDPEVDALISASRQYDSTGFKRWIRQRGEVGGHNYITNYIDNIYGSKYDMAVNDIIGNKRKYEKYKTEQGLYTGGVVKSPTISPLGEKEPEVVSNQSQIARAENYFRLLSGQMSLDSYLPKIGAPNVSTINNNSSTIDKGTNYNFYNTKITSQDATGFFNEIRRRATVK